MNSLTSIFQGFYLSFKNTVSSPSCSPHVLNQVPPLPHPTNFEDPPPLPPVSMFRCSEWKLLLQNHLFIIYDSRATECMILNTFIHKLTKIKGVDKTIDTSNMNKLKRNSMKWSCVLFREYLEMLNDQILLLGVWGRILLYFFPFLF